MKVNQLIKILKERYSQLFNLAGQNNQNFISVRDWNEAGQVVKVLEMLEITDMAIVSDAGTPLISDPGYKVVKAAKERGFGVVPIPGACAVTTALSAAGLPTNKFIFLGYLLKKWEIPKETTAIIYESPKRIAKTLTDIRNRYPNSQIVVAREMTKIYEYIGPDDARTAKGEVTILVYIPKE